MPALLELDPVPKLLQRVRAELGADFGDRPVRVSRAPGRLDVMGGIADYTGSLVCELPLDRAAAVALQERSDRQVQVFSFNLLDEHKPFTLRIPLDAVANQSADELRREFAQPGRAWAGYLVGCLFVLHEQRLIDLRDPRHAGVNLALYSTVPLGAGISSSAAIEVATLVNLLDHFQIRSQVDALRTAAMCQQVENRIVGAPCGIMDQVTSCAGEAGMLLRMLCQPHELQPALAIPDGMRFVGINSNVKHSVGGSAYTRTRCAAFMAHKIILELMRRAGANLGREMLTDPMRGYLANLDPQDYKQFFRPRLPDLIKGSDFLSQYGPTMDQATAVDPAESYPVQHAADHHVLEARRVQQFAAILGKANREEDSSRRGVLLDQAGHLMYASHLSYGMDAMLGAPGCDLIVDLVKAREKKGLYGAKITGGGSGGTVAILAETGEKPDQALGEILLEYQKQTGNQPELFKGSSPGAWRMGSGLECQ
jgi:L-arabinokinase